MKRCCQTHRIGGTSKVCDSCQPPLTETSLFHTLAGQVSFIYHTMISALLDVCFMEELHFLVTFCICPSNTNTLHLPQAHVSEMQYRCSSPLESYFYLHYRINRQKMGKSEKCTESHTKCVTRVQGARTRTGFSIVWGFLPAPWHVQLIHTETNLYILLNCCEADCAKSGSKGALRRVSVMIKHYSAI